MQCVRCGKEIDLGDLFCGYCGVNQAKYAKYLEKVSKKNHKEQDKEYNKRVAAAQKKVARLKAERQKEIERIESGRWESFVTESFLVNMSEGRIRINGTDFRFSDVKGAEVVKDTTYKVVTTEKVQSRKHGSLGGAVAGGLLFGTAGALVGGAALGKTKSTGSSVSDTVPMCSYIGVRVDMGGFTTEIPVLTDTVENFSELYNDMLANAQQIVDKLRVLSTTPESEAWLAPQEEASVLALDAKISEAKKELRRITEDKPNYEVPNGY